LTLTQGQIQASFNVDDLLDTCADCLRFVTGFFEVISQSAPHIYHSALLLAPKSSIVRKLYGESIRSPVETVVTGVPASWDSCTASAGTKMKVSFEAWSPCGQFIAAALGGIIEVRDSNTLEMVSVLKFPDGLSGSVPGSPAFSSDGRLIACKYFL